MVSRLSISTSAEVETTQTLNSSLGLSLAPTRGRFTAPSQWKAEMKSCSSTVLFAAPTVPSSSSTAVLKPDVRFSVIVMLVRS